MEAKAKHDADLYEEYHLQLLQWLNDNHAGYYWAMEKWQESGNQLKGLKQEQRRLCAKKMLFKKKCLRLKNKVQESPEHVQLGWYNNKIKKI